MHELSSLGRRETAIKPQRGVCWADGVVVLQGAGHAGTKPPWNALCALGLNLISIPPFLNFFLVI